MSIKATHMITRATALAIMCSRLQDVPDDALADMLEDFPESHFRNYTVHTQEELDADDLMEYPTCKIRNIHEF